MITFGGVIATSERTKTTLKNGKITYFCGTYVLYVCASFVWKMDFVVPTPPPVLLGGKHVVIAHAARH